MIGCWPTSENVVSPGINRRIVAKMRTRTRTRTNPITLKHSLRTVVYYHMLYYQENEDYHVLTEDYQENEDYHANKTQAELPEGIRHIPRETRTKKAEIASESGTEETNEGRTCTEG